MRRKVKKTPDTVTVSNCSFIAESYSPKADVVGAVQELAKAISINAQALKSAADALHGKSGVMERGLNIVQQPTNDYIIED